MVSEEANRTKPIRRSARIKSLKEIQDNNEAVTVAEEEKENDVVDKEMDFDSKGTTNQISGRKRKGQERSSVQEEEIQEFEEESDEVANDGDDENDEDYVPAGKRRKKTRRNSSGVKGDGKTKKKKGKTRAGATTKKKGKIDPYLWEPEEQVLQAIQKVSATDGLDLEKMNDATPITASREAIRAVKTQNYKLLKEVINATETAHTVYISVSSSDSRTAIDLAISNNDIEATKLLIAEYKGNKQSTRVNLTNKLASMGSGHYNGAYGRRNVIGIARGGKEGQNALLDDAIGTYRNSNRLHSTLSSLCRYPLTTDMVDLLLTEFSFARGAFSDGGFYQACQSGQQKLAHYISRNLLSWGYGVNALHVTSLSPDGEAFEKYRSVSVTKKHSGAFGIRPIHCAAINANTDYLKELMDAVMNPNSVADELDRKIIHFAAAAESQEPLKYVLESGADICEMDKKNTTPLHLAAKFGREENVKLLLQDDGRKDAIINAKTKDGFSALHMAAYFGHTEVVRALIEAGADVNLLTSRKETPLTSAARRGHLEIVKLLMENGAQLKKVDKTKKSALHHAVKNGHFDVAKHLITEHNANPNSADSSGNTVLHYAAAYGWLPIVKLLVACGVDVNTQNDWKGYALQLAVLKSHTDIADYLLKINTINLDMRDSEGFTLLLSALATKSDDSLRQIEYICGMKQIDITATDKDKRGVFHFLAMSPHQSDIHIGELLIKKKAPMDEVDSHGETPLSLAFKYRNVPLISFFLSKGVRIEVHNEKTNLLHIVASNVMNCNISELWNILKKNLEQSVLQQMADSVNENGHTPFLLLLSNSKPAITMRHSQSKYGAATGHSLESFLAFLHELMSVVDVDLTASVQLVRDTKKQRDNEESDIGMDDSDEDMEEILSSESDSSDGEEGSEKVHEIDGRSLFQWRIGWTAAHFAVSKQNFALLNFLVEKNVNIDIPCALKKTPLHYAMVAACSRSLSNIEMVKFLLQHGADINSVDASGRLPAHYIFVSHYEQEHPRGNHFYHDNFKDPIELVSDMAVVDEVEFDMPDKWGRTPLMYAAIRGATISSMYLLQRGADINREDEDGNTPLVLSLLAGHVDYAVTLVQKNANTRAKVTMLDKIGTTHAQTVRDAQNQASKKGHQIGSGHAHFYVDNNNNSNNDQQAPKRPVTVSLFRLVLQKNFMGLAYLLMDMGSTDPERAITDALNTRSYAITEPLISKTKKDAITRTNDLNQNMFHILASHAPDDSSTLGPDIPKYAATVGNSHFSAHSKKIACVLKEKGVNLRVCDVYGRTPLHYAVIRKNKPLVSYLLDNGADINVMDKRGRTPLHYSVCVGYPDISIVKLLVRQDGIDPNITDHEGKTAAHFAISPNALGSFEQSELLHILISAKSKFDIADKQSLTAVSYAFTQKSGAMLVYLKAEKITIDESTKQKADAIVSHLRDDLYALPEKVVLDVKNDAVQERESLEKKWNEKHKDHIQEHTLKPDSRAKVKNGVILKKDGISFDVLLSKTKISFGAHGYNNFYLMQIVCQEQMGLYVLFTCWGNVGERGEYQRTPFATAEEAITEFKRVFRSKTGNHWENSSEDKFEHHANKYKIVFRDRFKVKDKNLLQPLNLKKAPKSLLEHSVQALITSFADVVILKRYMHSVGIRTGDMQTGKLTRSTLERGLDKMNEILDLIKELEQNSTMDIKTRREKFDKLTDKSSEFYEIIPHTDYSTRAVTPFTSEVKVAKTIQTIGDLMEIEVATEIAFAAQRNISTVNPIDYIYHALDTHIIPCGRDSMDFGLVQSYVTATNDSHRLCNVFRINRREDVERFAPYQEGKDRMLLWHGSKCSNFISILKGGLKVTPSNATCTGTMFGSGIYFSDTFRKAYGYTDRSQSGSSFLLLCDVYLGNIKELHNADVHLQQAPAGFQSVHGLGRFRPCPSKKFVTWDQCEVPIGMIEEYPSPWAVQYNEFIVYDPSQVRVRYIVEIK